MLGMNLETPVKDARHDDHLDSDSNQEDEDQEDAHNVDDELVTFERDEKTFWANSTSRFVSKHGLVRKTYPVSKKLKGTQFRDTLMVQRKRALHYAKTGEDLPMDLPVEA
eukprot:7689021-Karenia_brevis.AAC.1